MNPKTRSFLIANGMPPAASDTEAEGWLAGLKTRGVAPSDTTTSTSAPAPATSAATAPTAPAPANEEMRALQARLDEVDMYCRSLKIPDDYAEQLKLDPEMSGHQLRQACANYLAGRTNSATTQLPGGGRADVGVEAADKTRAAIIDGLLMRSGRQPAGIDPTTGQPLSNHRYADGAAEFRGMSILRIGALLLRQSGINVDRMSDTDIAQHMLTRSAAQTSHDFPLVLGDYLNKHLLSASAAVTRDWLPFVKVVPASDFRPIHAIQLGGDNKFGRRDENGDFAVARYVESGQSYRPHMYGLKTQLTLEILLHDDLRALTRQPDDMLAAQIATERELFFAALTSTAVMSDGQQLFSSAHENVSTVSAVRGDAASFRAALKEARIRLGRQRTATGMPVKVAPKSILATLDDYELLYGIASEPRVATADNPIGTANANYGMSVVSADEISLAFYTFADPAVHPAIEAAWYNGQQGVNLFQQPHYAGLHVEYTGWTGFGLGVVGHHGVDRTTVSLS